MLKIRKLTQKDLNGSLSQLVQSLGIHDHRSAFVHRYFMNPEDLDTMRKKMNKKHGSAATGMHFLDLAPDLNHKLIVPKGYVVYLEYPDVGMPFTYEVFTSYR